MSILVDLPHNAIEHGGHNLHETHGLQGISYQLKQGASVVPLSGSRGTPAAETVSGTESR
jgi:hypothetical protein